MRRTPTLVALIAALCLPAGASAATWSAPQDLSPAHTFVDDPTLSIASSGRALAAWSFVDGIGQHATSGTGTTSRAPGAGAFAAPRTLGPVARLDRRPVTTTGPLTFGAGRAIAAATRKLVSDPADQRVRLEALLGGAGGRFAAPRTIAVARDIRSVSLAVDARGDAALAWFEDLGVRTDRVYVSLRRAGHGFGTPRLLARGHVRSVAAAVGAKGDVLVAWDARGTLRTRYKRHTRAGFAGAETIRSQPAYFAALHPVVAPSGRAVLAWSAQFLSEGGSSGPIYFQAAVRPAGGRFRTAQLLEKMGAEQVDRPLDAVVDSTGAVVVAWSGTDGTARRVRVARDDGPGRSFGTPVDVSAPGDEALVSDLAAGPGGRLIAVWDNGSFDANQVRAAVSDGTGQPFGAPEDVSPAQQARAGHAAFDPRTGVPTVVWTNRPAGSAGHSAATVRTFAQAAHRSG